MKKIELTQGKFALVDDEDYEWLSKYRWYYSTGRAVITRGDRNILMHRAIMQPENGFVIDHINGDTLDNRKGNLRICEQKDNMRNRQISKNNTSGFKGVTSAGKYGWRAQIEYSGKVINLGNYADKLEAAHAYDEAARKYFGEFARTNFYQQS